MLVRKASDYSGTGPQATGNISGWDPANPQTSGFTSIVFRHGLQDPYVENWFVGLQRELRPKLTVEFNYVGTAGRNLFRAENVNRIPGRLLPEGTCATDNFGRELCSQRNTNTLANKEAINPIGQLNPNYGRLRVWENTASSIYNSMQASIRKQLSRGLQFGGNYTYSHSIDDGSSWQSSFTSVNGSAAGDGITTDQTQPGLDRGNSVFDIRHRLTFNYIWELPFFRNSGGRVLQRSAVGNGMAYGHSRAEHTGLPSICEHLGSTQRRLQRRHVRPTKLRECRWRLQS
jgi:hypothetical protein